MEGFEDTIGARFTGRRRREAECARDWAEAEHQTRPARRSATLAGFDADDRARAIERWLSADGVLDSLYPEEVGGPAPAEHK